ncbi:MAG: YgjP-like metallopeptidase domain-containing protein, partial [Candidatus Falkowbacteria bacterium]
MKKEIIVDGQKIEYTIKKYRGTKNIRLVISSNGSLVASKPWYLSERSIEKFIREKADWIIEKIEHLKKTNKVNIFRSSQKEYLIYKKQAERLIAQKIDKLNLDYQFKFSKISIRNQKTRWGS